MIPFLLTLSAIAFAADDDFAPYGEVRYIGSQLQDFAVDADGQNLGQSRWLDQRIRLGTLAKTDLAEVTMEFDAFTGQLAGDTWDIPGDVDEQGRGVRDTLTAAGLVPRRLSAKSYLGDYQIELGLVSATWGLGMVANDGGTDPLFGRADFGDRSVRLRTTHIPSSDGPAPRTTWLITGAVDFGIADDIARLSEGQQTLQGIFSALALGRRGSKAGTYAVVRQQWEDQEGRQTQAAVVDGYADVPWTLAGDWTVRTAAEVAGIIGRTNRATTYNARDWLGVLSLGAAGVVTLASPEERVQTHLMTGYASGDGSPDDGITRDFTFDRDFGAGMVLFDQLMGGIEAATYNQLTDPTLAGTPPDGVDALVTEGAFRRATYVQPAIELKPVDWLDVRTGVMLAWATAPVSQPFYSYRGGGTPYNHHNQPSEGRSLGTEIDWALGVTRPADSEGLRPSLEVQGGHLLVGKALQGDGPETITLLTAAFRACW